MPFPLHALDYGSRCRLRELAAPGEAYDLQIAAPHLDGLNPIQEVIHFLDQVEISIVNNECCAEEVSHSTEKRPLSLSGNELYMFYYDPHITNLTSEHSAHTICNRFHFGYCTIMFSDCTITPKFLCDFAAKTGESPELEFFGCAFANVNIALLFTLFNNLKRLTFGNVQLLEGSWFETQYVDNSAKTKCVTFYNASIDILNVDETTIIKFMKAQCALFVLDIALKEPKDDKAVRQKLDRLFSKQFWSLKPNSFRGKSVRISWPKIKNPNLKRCYVLRGEASP